MESYVLYLQGLYEAMFSDIAEYYPSLQRDCRRDSSRLLSLIESRGLPFLMVDLPDMGKHFDRCLSNELLTPSGLPGNRRYKKGSVIPRLFKGLLLRVFDDNGVLRSDRDVVAIRLLRQLYYGAKKMKVACDSSKTWEHVHEFFTVDQEVRLPSLDWDADELELDRLDHLTLCDDTRSCSAPLFHDHVNDRVDEESYLQRRNEMDAVQRTADIVVSALGGFDPSQWRFKHGPGAVSDQRHTQFKYDFPNWPHKLEAVFPQAEFAFANYDEWVRSLTAERSHDRFRNHEPPSKLIAVPKTLKGPRLIAAEPVSHQWCQQSLKDFFVGRLPYTPINSVIHFRDQTFNQELAREASHTQSHVTVDLSSASDRLSCWVVERIFRRSSTLVAALHATRTRWVVNTIDRKSPSSHRLRKFACMGSACTFPVQSIVFAILSISAVLISRRMRPTIRNIREISQEVQVFGDDMIVPSDSWVVLQGLLGDLGLKVNPLKTYDTGKFRESCGLDAYDGNDVSPTYSITYPDVSRPESIISCVETHKNFVLRGLVHSAQYIRSRVERIRNFRIPLVPIGSGAFGWSDLYSLGNSHLRSKWDPMLHRRVYQVDYPCGRSTRNLPDSDSLLLQYFTEVRPGSPVLGDRLGKVERVSTNLRRRWVALDDLSTERWQAA